MSDESKPMRSMPQTDLDFNLMITDTLWGSPFVHEDLKESLTKQYALVDEQGNYQFDEKGRPLVKKEALWGLMSYYTRDLRLGNLSNVKGEFAYCQYYLDLAGDLLKLNMINSFMVALSRAVSVLELSQSKGGFLRKQMNTLTQEQKSEIVEPSKKRFMSGNR